MATRKPPSVTVAGAGILGLWQAVVLARSGYAVTLRDAREDPFAFSASRWAGAMLAPDCEAEAAPPIVRDLGRGSLRLWREVYPDVVVNGTLVVAASRDAADLKRFARLTERHEQVGGERIGVLEPALSGRFSAALYYAGEAHMDAMAAMKAVLKAAKAAGVACCFGCPWDGKASDDLTIDCRGYGARDDIPGLRGVRGERLLIGTADVVLNRPVRLLHPRQPIYVVPQGDGRFVVGATVIERDDGGAMTVRSALELLGSVYALHPGFAEARVIEAGAGVRPAFADNVPRILVEPGGKIIRVNGAYRHGFLLAPVLAQGVADYLQAGARSALMRDVTAASD